jgi:sugar lactone lactonase YvrE
MRTNCPFALAVSFAVAALAGCSHETRERPDMRQMPATAPAERVSVITGQAAQRGAESLATARGGPGQGKHDARLEAVALFNGKAMPTGVTVSREGRIFLCYPRWGDPVNHTVVELKGDQLVPFPDAQTTSYDPGHPEQFDPRTHLVSVQSVVVDDRDRLWILDPASINFGPVVAGGPKMWGYDLSTGRRTEEIRFPPSVARKMTYLNDVRVDVNRGPEGTAYITDSGEGGIIVVDLATGAAWRRLDGHPSVMPEQGLKQVSEGEPLMRRKPNGQVEAAQFHSDGIALSPDGRTLYYNAITSRDIWSVPTELLADRNADEQKVAAAVKKVATKASGNDGLICDSQGRIYSTDFEDNAIRRTDPNTGNVEIVAQDARLLWPDTFATHGDWLYVTDNQLARQPNFHFGKDERQPPYAVFRLRVEGAEKAGGTK